MKYTFTLLLFSIVVHSSAQQFQMELDSLIKKIDSSPVANQETIDLRNQYIKQALFANPSDTTLLTFSKKTVDLARDLRYWKGLLVGYERVALVYQYSFSNPYKALEYYHKALGLMEKDKDLQSLGWGIYGGIGTLYYEQEEYGKALEQFKKVLHNDKNLELTATANIANIFGSLNQLDSAIYYYKKALNLEQVTNNPTYKANLYSNLSLIYSQADQLDAALASAENSIGLIEQYGIEFVRPTAYANASMAYLGNKDYVNAELYANKALQLSEAQGNVFLQKSAWGTLADVYSAKGEFSKALEAYTKFSVLKDSLNNQNRRVEINRSQLEFEFEKERTIAQAEIDRQSTIKTASLLGGGGLLAASVLGFVLYKRRRDVLEQKKDAEFRALVADTELKALRAQMNPHFIFNALNSIGDYILKNNNETALEYLTKFAKLMRMVLENSENKSIPLEEDLKFLELYLQVEAKRQPGKFSYHIQVDEALEVENTLVPPLLLQPFIENSIWHGFRDRDGMGQIQITINENQDMLICSIEDNGRGIEHTANGNESKKSFGVAITENRLKILNKQKNKEGRLQVIDLGEQKGTRVEISLPLEHLF
ncbi:histidine kinase [Muricauda ruestringensis]|uniref:Histidine kinase n=1 Tax=Flagellimonas aurea TaxID=2915619 RepID=A0ABS3G357_9FLAO|nr:histidine kinase [Allomuricauda aurea]MBO0353393.1 histidine kinase [Allomuricauda aurea]